MADNVTACPSFSGKPTILAVYIDNKKDGNCVKRVGLSCALPGVPQAGVAELPAPEGSSGWLVFPAVHPPFESMTLTFTCEGKRARVRG